MHMILKLWQGILKALGYSATTDINQADVILINTCAIRENAENKVLVKLEI